MTYAERACLRVATLVAFPPSLRCDCRRDAVAGDLHHQRAAANAVLEKSPTAALYKALMCCPTLWSLVRSNAISIPKGTFVF
jgi:hypothetical protein